MAEKKDFQYYKKWALGVIKKQIAELDKEEKKNKKIAKAFSLAETEIEKAFPVGTIRTWKGKKFIKSPDKKWRPYYEKHDTKGAKRTLSLLAKKINALEDDDFEGLYKLLKLHESRFLSEGNQLMEIYKLAKEKGANVGERFSPAKKRKQNRETAEKLAKKYGLYHANTNKKEEEKPKDEPKEEEKPKDEPKKEEKPKGKTSTVGHDYIGTKEYEDDDEFYRWSWDRIDYNTKVNCGKITECKSEDDVINIQAVLGYHVARESVRKAFEGLSEEDSNALLSWIKKEAIACKVDKHHLWIHHAFDIFCRKKETKDGWSAATIKDKYERESKTFGKINFSEQCIRHAWESPTEILPEWDSKTQTNIYVAYGNTGARMDNGYMEKFDQGETTRDLATGYTAIPFGTFTKEELAQFERIKPRIAAIKRELGDDVIALHEDTKKFLKALYDAKVKDPDFKAYHDYDAFMLWRRDGYLDSNITMMTSDEEMAYSRKHAPYEHKWEQKRRERQYGKSFCYFDKTGRLWIKKSALNAFNKSRREE